MYTFKFDEIKKNGLISAKHFCIAALVTELCDNKYSFTFITFHTLKFSVSDK